MNVEIVNLNHFLFGDIKNETVWLMIEAKYICSGSKKKTQNPQNYLFQGEVGLMAR